MTVSRLLAWMNRNTHIAKVVAVALTESDNAVGFTNRRNHT